MSWEGPASLGGVLPPGSVPAAVSRGPNSVDAFGISLQGSLFKVAHFHWNGSWHGPTLHGGVDIGSDCGAIASSGARVDVFAVDRSNPTGNFEAVIAQWAEEAGWTGPTLLPSAPPHTSTNMTPAVVSTGPGSLDLFLPASDAAGEVRRWWFDGSWHGPVALPTSSGLSAGCITAVHSGADRIDVFAADAASGNLVQWSRIGGTWSAPSLLGGQLMSLAPLSAVSWAPGRIDVFAAGGTGPLDPSSGLLHFWFDGSWHGPVSLGDGLANSPSGPAAVSRGAGLLDVFAIQNSGQLMHFRFDGGWHGPALLGGNAASTPAVVSRGPGLLDVFAIDANSHELMHWVWQRSCSILLERSTIGKGEIDALHAEHGWPARIQPALCVIVEGFSADDLGLNSGNLSSPPVLPTVTTSASSVTAHFYDSVIPEDISLPSNRAQRFLFPFRLSFANAHAFDFSGDSAPLDLHAELSPPSGPAASADASMSLVPSPNPFILHGDSSNDHTWYLSVDTRVFQVVEGHSRFGAGPLSTSLDARDAATTFVHEMLHRLNSDVAGHTPAFLALPQDESGSQLTLAPRRPSGERVFNFAIARVHYRDPNQDVSPLRVFFRLWPAQQTNATYDHSTYGVGGPNSDGQPIAVLGRHGTSIMTVPFFANRRVAPSVSMNEQRDPDNVRVIHHDGSGAEVTAFFGCWLDINQPSDARFPASLAGGVSAAGPFSGSLVSVQQLVRSAHQCLLVELSFPGLSIASGSDPSNCDKLAQRNLAFVDVPNPGREASRVVPQTFEIRPTPAALVAQGRFDELLIEWRRVPRCSIATVYLPELDAHAIVALADRLYDAHGLVAIEPHALQCPASSATYIPIPGPHDGSGQNHVGLLSLELPEGVRAGQRYDVIVKQITSAGQARTSQEVRSASLFAGATLDVAKAGANAKARSLLVKARRPKSFRRVLGLFKLTVPVHPTASKPALLESERRLLSILRWIELAIPASDRWRPVFERYLEQVAGRVRGLGGDPAQVQPNGNGDWQKPQATDVSSTLIGKIGGLLYDHFGDFEGFVLETTDCQRHLVHSRERRVEELARRAWLDRSLVEARIAPDTRCLRALLIGGQPPNCAHGT